jgi:acetoin utilization deacetylase AcuC-like enzyme
MSHTGFVYDDIFLKHETMPGHPERPARLEAIVSMLDETGLANELHRIAPREATLDDLTRVHEPHYVDFVKRAVESGQRVLDMGDTCVGPHSYRAALMAAGGVLAAVDAIVAGDVRNAFCAVRPPGHHAEAAQAMGFCLFNNVAVGARYAQAVHGLESVLIIDWDVHHGNGTQHAFYDDDTVLYVSTHQSPHYPGTGAASETGHGRGEGFSLNIPMRAGAGDAEFTKTFNDVIAPRADQFAPDLVLISAGFDAHDADPLSGLELTSACYGELTRIVKGIADRHAAGRLVSVLEGGYDLRALRGAVEAHLRALMRE